MVLQRFFPALVGAALLMAGATSIAAEYRADEFLGLDLSKAVLSPKPLGPATEFAPAAYYVPAAATNAACRATDVRPSRNSVTGMTTPRSFSNSASRRTASKEWPPRS